jgi:2-polyprenyl-6-methoxyphenol hydroxylase-like FAD-dependent oxidoreductase
MALDRAPTTATRRVRRNATPDRSRLDVDVCVVGAGISGVAAALESAKLGRKVALVDGLPALGGQAVNSIIGIFCGLFGNGSNGRQFTFGVAEDILRDLGEQGVLHYRRGPFTTVVMYDEVALSRWIEESVRKAGIDPVLGAVLTDVHREGPRIARLDLETRYGGVDISAKGFVDASGDAALSWLAGVECQEPEAKNYGTQMVVLENVAEDDYPDRFEMADRLARLAPEYGLVRHDGFAFNFTGRGIALVNMTHIETPLEPLAASRVALEGKAQADKAVHYLKAEYPKTFGNARVRAYGFPGIRQTRWITGRHHITVDEVRTGVRFDDAIGRTSWPIEIHDAAEGHVWEPFDEDHVHYIPFGALVSPELDNMVAAGRCIDGDAAALSSVRVMGPCMAMGTAAAHALEIAGAGSVHQLDIGELQSRLKRNLEFD